MLGPLIIRDMSITYDENVNQEERRITIPDLTHNGKVVLVTGGRQDLGRAMALAFAEAGADIAICDMVTDDGSICC